MLSPSVAFRSVRARCCNSVRRLRRSFQRVLFQARRPWPRRPAPTEIHSVYRGRHIRRESSMGERGSFCSAAGDYRPLAAFEDFRISSGAVGIDTVGVIFKLGWRVVRLGLVVGVSKQPKPRRAALDSTPSGTQARGSPGATTGRAADRRTYRTTAHARADAASPPG